LLVAYDPKLWTRLVADGIPIYVRPDRPDWFVPNTAGDHILQDLAGGPIRDGTLHVQRFLDRLPDSPAPAYRGRAEHLTTDYLREVWFHVTNRCNMACRHCLFASGPNDSEELAADEILALARQAAKAGCRVFALTGGEPLVHGEFERLVDGLLDCSDANVAVLTNGQLLPRFQDAIARWPLDRFHLQVSIDGLREAHDRIRGHGAFDELAATLAWLRREDIACTLSMCVSRENVDDMPQVVEFAAEQGISNVHFMWYFVRGRGGATSFAPTDQIGQRLKEAADVAERCGVAIDNLDVLKSQIFAPPGTIHDGSTSGWEAVAIGPDGRLYPSAALIGFEDLSTEIAGDLVKAWRDSPVLQRLRQASAVELDQPMRYLLGGGDPDHSYTAAGEFVGGDPYTPLYEQTALWLLAREASRLPDNGTPRLRLKMGDVLESCGPHGSVATVHSNCLLSLAHEDGRTAVREFYADAVTSPRQDILNPVNYPDELIEHIPDELRVRSYGCGSPVLEAELAEGERVLDLGSGSGVECFIAARLVGPSGHVIGVDMLDAMISLADKGADGIAERLGYRNLEFRKGYLEDLPIEDDSLDVVLSNCVLNLSTHKRRTFAEIRRVLRPGGRLVVSDVVCETEPDPAIRNDELLRGQCIAGALTQRDLFGLLDESGFVRTRVLGHFPYRTVGGHPFYSMTFVARTVAVAETVRVMYRGPFASVVTSGGSMLPAGQTRDVLANEVHGAGDEIFEFDDQGHVTNAEIEPCACCASPPEEQNGLSEPVVSLEKPIEPPRQKQRSGCMVCGSPLVYHNRPSEAACSYCGTKQQTTALCENGHFVCDACHTEDALVVIERVCQQTDATDMISLLDRIRRHEAMRVHGPEHHAMVPAIILATARNLGAPVTEEMIRLGIQRGSRIGGGHCAYMGACGAALGLGVAFSLILGCSPLKGSQRKTVQSAVMAALEPIAALDAARCCQRDSWLALKKAAELSHEILPVKLQADAPLRCAQVSTNAQCMGATCPLFPSDKVDRCECPVGED